MRQNPAQRRPEIDLAETVKIPRAQRQNRPQAPDSPRPSRPAPATGRHRIERWILPIAITLFVLLYSPAFLLPYGYADDYAVLAAFQYGGKAVSDLVTMMALGGRPVMALLTAAFYLPAHHLVDLQVLRLVGVVLIGVLAWLLFMTFRRVGAGLLLASVAPILICVTPPFELHAGWAALSLCTLASIFAGFAALLVDTMGEQRSQAAWIGLFIAAVALETLAINVYQPDAMMLWVFAAIYLVMRDRSPRDFMRNAAIYGVVGVIAMGFDYLEIKLLPQFGLHSFVTARSTLDSNVAAKLVWFARNPLASALNVWSLRPSIALGASVALFIALGVMLYVSGAWRQKALKLALLAACVPAAYIPNLVVAELSAPFRTQTALTSLVVVCLILASVGYVRVARRYLASARTRRAFERGVALAGIVASLALGGLAAYNVTSAIALPEYTENALIQSQLRSADLAATQVIYIRMSCLSDSAAPIARYDEIGLPSSSISWAAPAMVAVDLYDMSPAYAAIPLTVEAPRATFSMPPRSAYVDARQLRYYRSSPPWTYGPLQAC